MPIETILIFIGKVIFIEVIIELLRQAFYAIWHDSWAKNLLHITYKNQYFDLFLQLVESTSVIILLFLGYSITFIIIAVYLFIFSIKEIGSRILNK